MKSMKVDGMTQSEMDKEILGIDSNVFLAVIVPGITKAPKEEIDAAEKVIRLLHKGEFHCVTSSIIFAEIRWVLMREGMDSYSLIEATLRETLRGKLSIVDVGPEIASESAYYRWKYYSKKNAFSYNDGIILTTSLMTGCKVIISTDPHLLQVQEIETLSPSNFLRARKKK